ncbi:MAG: M3 family oligoendopeptidase [Bacteroidia bacterium]
MKFSEFPYKRPDINSFETDFKNLINKFSSANSADEQHNIYQDIIRLRKEFDTNQEISQVRYTQDTSNKKFEEEQDFFDSNSPRNKDLVNDSYRALVKSKFRNELEKRYGSQLFKLAELSIKTIKPEIIDLLQQENKLTTSYTKLLSSAKIFFEGEERNLAGMSPFMQSADRDTRVNASIAYYRFFEQNQSELDRIYDELVKLRDKIAKKLGYKNFVALGYDRMLRTDYTAKDVADYREKILKYVVPVAKQLRERQAHRIGIEKLKYYDEPFEFKSGNPKPKGNPGWIVNNAKQMYSELSPETNEFFSFMIDNELMDLENRKNKAGGGYCTMFSKYGAPFIFSNFNGTSHDIDVLTHEAGHAFQGFSSRIFEVPEYFFPTFEACEIHSMSMEFFSWPWMELFFKEDTMKYKFHHLASSLLFLPYGVAVDEYQHFVYENPDVTPAERNKQWREIEKKYLPWRDYDGNAFLEKGGFWQRQAHIYNSPFYYIDYTLAQVCAFQFWVKAQDNMEEAFQDYLTLCKAGGSKAFLDLVKLAKLNSPFDDGVVENVVKEINHYLSGVDDTKL